MESYLIFLFTLTVSCLKVSRSRLRVYSKHIAEEFLLINLFRD